MPPNADAAHDGGHSPGSGRRFARRSAGRDSRQRRQSVPTLAHRVVRRGRRRTRRAASHRPRDHHVWSIGAGGRRTGDRERARAGASRTIGRASSIAATFHCRSCARSSIARRSTSAATADRCTSPPPATSRWSRCTGRRCPRDRRRGGRLNGGPLRSRYRASSAAPVTSASARQATSGAFCRIEPREVIEMAERLVNLRCSNLRMSESEDVRI